MADNPMVAMAMQTMLKALGVNPAQITDMMAQFVTHSQNAFQALNRIEEQNKRIIALLENKDHDNGNSGGNAALPGPGGGS